MTQTRDLIKKMADFFTGEEFYEKGEDARLELSPNDVRCMNEVIKACEDAISRQAVLDLIADYDLSMGQVVRGIHALPSVTPQPCEDAVSRQAVLDEAFEVDTKEYGRIDVVGVDAIGSLPPVNPQEPILDKIRAEIKAKIEEEEFARSVFRHEEKDTAKAEQCTGSIMAYNNVIKLIDKYKAEREDKGK